MSSGDEQLQQCYNPSCGKRYKESENSENACVYHAGLPVFHDAYKSWSCCKKKTTDFTEFLEIKGCTVGRHSNVKPVEPEKPRKIDQDLGVTTVCHKPVIPRENMKRPSEDVPMISLKENVSDSLRTQLENERLKAKEDPVLADQPNSTDIPVGTNCKNSGCRYVYEDSESKHNKCQYHPGTPIFHEGMKYWTCCQRKTSDFEMFLSQEGCESGDHLWFKVKTNDSKDTGNSCRLDWHQTGRDVVITIYSKLPIPGKCKIEASCVKLKLYIVFSGNEELIFTKDFLLYDIIEADQSFVVFTPSKVEISLKKKESTSWPRLCF